MIECLPPCGVATFPTLADLIDLSDRYHIVREIGAGGMARVLLARDLEPTATVGARGQAAMLAVK